MIKIDSLMMTKNNDDFIMRYTRVVKIEHGTCSRVVKVYLLRDLLTTTTVLLSAVVVVLA